MGPKQPGPTVSEKKLSKAVKINEASSNVEDITLYRILIMPFLSIFLSPFTLPAIASWNKTGKSHCALENDNAHRTLQNDNAH